MNKKGFTLIELLTVISIVGFIANIVFASFYTANVKARDTKRLADMRQIQTALELFHDDNAVYPDIAGEGDASCGGYDTSLTDIDSDNIFFIDKLQENSYISAMPADPLNTNIACNGGLGFTYRYYRYTAAAALTKGCENRAFYVLGVNNFEDGASPRPHPASPGFACNINFGGNPLSNTCGNQGPLCTNWQITFDWVVGGYE